MNTDGIIDRRNTGNRIMPFVPDSSGNEMQNRQGQRRFHFELPNLTINYIKCKLR